MRLVNERDISKLRRLREIQKLVPGNPAISTLVRWGQRGLLGRDGRRLKLPMRKIGGKLFVAESELWDWLDTLAAQPGLETVSSATLEPTELDRLLDAEQV